MVTDRNRCKKKNSRNGSEKINMTAKERVIAALEHRPTDRPPIFPVVTFEPMVKVMGKTLADAWIDPQLMYDALYAGWEAFGFDGFEIPGL